MRTPFLTLLALAALCAPLLTGCSPAVRGSMALSSGDYDRALGLYDEALASDPDSIYLRQRIGLTHFAKKDYANAETSFREILSLRPGEPNAAFYLGLSRIGKGERGPALRIAGLLLAGQNITKFLREEASVVAPRTCPRPDHLLSQGRP
jgi:tetratricopeptide (TPR) repeat protein